MSTYHTSLPLSNTDDELPGGNDESSDVDMDEDAMEDAQPVSHTGLHQLRTRLSPTSGQTESQAFRLVGNRFVMHAARSDTLRKALRFMDDHIRQPVVTQATAVQQAHPKSCRLMCWVVTIASIVGILLLILRYGGPDKLYPITDNPWPVGSLVIRPRDAIGRSLVTVDQTNGITRVDYTTGRADVPLTVWFAANGSWAARRGDECFASTDTSAVAPLPALVDLVLPPENEWWVEQPWVPRDLLFRDERQCVPGEINETTVLASQPARTQRADVLSRLFRGWLLENYNLPFDYTTLMEANFTQGTSADPTPLVTACEHDCACLYAQATALLEPFVNQCSVASMALSADCWVTNALLYQALLSVPCVTRTRCIKHQLVLPLRVMPYCPGLGNLLSCENQLAALSLTLETDCRVAYEHLEDYLPATTLAMVPSDTAVVNKTLV